MANARFEAVDVTKPISGRFDLATAFDVVHDLGDAQGALSNIAKALHPGGVSLIMDMAGSSHLEENLDHPVGPLHLSPMINCFDGMVVSWTIGTTPDAELVNTMLDTAITTLPDGE